MTVTDLKTKTMELGKEIADLVNTFEEETGYRVASFTEVRDEETREIVSVILPIFDEGIYG